MSFPEKIYFLFAPLIDRFLQAEDYKELLREKGFHFNRKQDGEDLCRP